MTGSGTVSNRAANFGNSARKTKTAAMANPTLRAATPVRPMSEEPNDEKAIVGGVPAMPASNIPTLLAPTAPCTCRKSIARCRRWEAFWMMTLSLMPFMASTSVSTIKVGSSVQNSSPNVRSSPGN